MSSTRDAAGAHGDALGVAGASWSSVSLDLPAGLPFDDWQGVGWALGRIRDLTAWALGDWLAFGEATFGERYAQGVEATGRAKSTLLEYGRVSRLIPRASRRPGLSFTHHQLVAARKPDEQAKWLDQAQAHKWSVEEFRGALRAEPALPTRRNQTLPTGEALELQQRPIDHAVATTHAPTRSLTEAAELVHDAARALLQAAEPLGDGFARIPIDLVDRLACALGETG